MIIACDFDDTIMNTKDVRPGYRMGRPEPGAVLALQKLVQEGHTLVLFTARNVQNDQIRKAVQDWLDYFQIPIHAITNVKQDTFDVMIDDRGLRFHNWAQVLGDLKKIEQHPQPHLASDSDQEFGLFTDISKPMDQQ